MIAQFTAAPWSPLLKLTSVGTTLLLAGLGGWLAHVVPLYGASHPAALVAMVLAPAILLGALLFVVNGYAIHDRELRIRRLLWQTSIDLSGLRSANPDALLLRGSLRIAGNGGVFSFSGYFWNRRIGRYRAFVTDWKRAVVLQLPRQIIVVSPSDPAAFVQYLHGSFSGLDNRD